ncbi:GntR family transcriptional regulator [Bradyrhizobium sp. USDA 336]|uniref:GntR family transcriptional regulator n=1 Tax=Bradyrhizobium sp. USDA 336 TaxID=3156311 RepID=UPI003836694B
MLKPIEKRSSEQQATEALRAEILSGRIHPGTRLVEADVAQAFALSRGTIRGALQHLATEGLIVPSAFRGYEVTSLTSHDVWEIYTLRNAYESMAARMVAGSIDPSKIQRITDAFSALKRVVETHDKAAIFEHDAKLHGTIVSLTEHSRLQYAYRILAQQTRLFYVLCNEFMSFEDYVTSHIDIVDAILAGDVDRAGRLAADHNTADGQAVVDKLRAQETEASARKPFGFASFRPSQLTSKDIAG